MFFVIISVFIAETRILPGLSRSLDARRVRKRKERYIRPRQEKWNGGYKI
jgi:hypothetical protein